MKKEEFLEQLRSRISGLPEKDIKDRLDFYSEAIDDRVEEGKSEEEAVREMGSIDEVVNQIASETSLTKLVKEKYRPTRSIKPWEIVLIIFGFPLWFPLMLTLVILLLVLCILVWVLAIVTYSTEIGLIGMGSMGLITFFGYLSQGDVYIFSLGVSLLSFGVAILFVYVCKWATIASWKFAKYILLGIKKLFIGGKKNA